VGVLLRQRGRDVVALAVAVAAAALFREHAGDGRPALPVAAAAAALVADALAVLDGGGLHLVLGVGLGEALVQAVVGAGALLLEALLHLADAGFEGFEL